MEQSIKVEGQFSGAINFAMQQNYVPVVRSLILTNITNQDLTNLKLKISFEPQFAKEYEINIERLLPNEPVEITPIKIILSPDFLFSQTERMVGNIHIEVFEKEMSRYLHDTTIELMACDEWAGLLTMPEIISAFVTPNHPKIIEIITKAGTYLDKWTGNPAFTGYQTNNPNIVKLQMAAIYAALEAENIVYILPPASYEVRGQRIRLPHAVLEQKLGTCLDLSLLYASCLESIGLNALLVFIQGHAFAGCWLDEDTFPECTQDDVSAMTKRLAKGIEELSVIECTDFVASNNVRFDKAEKHANDHFIKVSDFQMVVDVMRCRGSGIRPIPVRVTAGSVGSETNQADFGKASAPKMMDLKYRGATAVAGELTKQKLWERKLLDLSLRNTLLNFRVTKNAVQLMISNLSLLEDELARGEDFRILPTSSAWADTIKDVKIFEIDNDKDLIETIAQAEFKSKRIRTFLDEVSLEISMKNIYRQAKLSLEENGANTLYLALGFLKWFESDISEKPRYAPIVLIPVDIVRRIQDKSFAIRIRDEEAQMNITLLEMLRQDFGLNITGLDPLPADESGIDLKLVYNTIRQGVMAKNRWDVEEISFIGLFQFSQFIMWNDIRNRVQDLQQNKVVASLISGKMEWKPVEDCLEAWELDENISPNHMAIPTSVDSSQLAAVCAAAKGQSFVLHGPPGTGKSQTITNMIANALYQGKSVLFVAEKMAALTVVQKRLEAVGLAPFCLELHSNKAQKRTVLDQLERTLQVGQIKKPEEYEETAVKLHELRTVLNNVMIEIHKKRPSGMSFYEAIVKYENSIEHAGKVNFSKETISKVTGDTFIKWREMLSRLKVAALDFGGVRNAPFPLFESRVYSLEIRDNVKRLLEEYAAVLESLKKQSEAMSSCLNLQHKNSYEYVSDLCKSMLILNNAEYISAPALQNKELKLMDYSLRDVISNGQSKARIEKQINEDFYENIYRYDFQTAEIILRQAGSKWFLPKWLTHNKLLKEIRLNARNPKNIKKENLEGFYQLLITHEGNTKVVNEADTNIKAQFGSLWNNVNPDWNLINKSYMDSFSLQETLRKMTISTKDQEAAVSKIVLYTQDLSRFQEEYGPSIIKFTETLENMKSIEKQLTETYSVHVEALHLQDDWMSYTMDEVKSWIANLSELKAWTMFLQISDEINAVGLSEIYNAYRNGAVSEDDLIPCYECNLAYAIINDIMTGNDILSKFEGVQFEESIERYKEVLKEFEILTIKELVSKLSGKIPRTSVPMANSSEIGILQKAIKSGGRMMSIRKLFDSIPTLLRRLRPCMLMSPISVAQYIDPSYPKFDLVIFDEASQLPTCEAVGTIARGENVVVVGDPKQLPPTSFFSSNHVDEENYDKEDLESLLDDCLALSMPQKHLQWHYRSRHESLIAYSNMKYYDNKLFTFPSPNDLISEVKWIPIQGFYDKGNSKQNRAEAEAVVKELVGRLKSQNRDSLGVVTFSSVQQILIDDLLMEEFRKNPELEKINNESPEPIFIKNLENVQGDERDIILFSVGYGPDKEGKVSMNFGPLNREGGWRRLNVAISRARKSMLVYSTLKPEQIDPARTRSEGVAGLRGFLEFAARGKNTLAVRNGTQSEKNSDIETMIAERIKEMGYEAKCNIGCSEYKIDIGVVNPKNPQAYILGIMFDGENYRKANTARDRNVLQPSILEGLGWNLYQVWVIDWLDSQDKVLKNIKTAIENAIALDSTNTINNALVQNSAIGLDRTSAFGVEKLQISPPLRKAEIEFEKVYEEEPKKVNEYRAAEIKIKGTQENFYDTVTSQQIKDCIREVITVEAPISRRNLFRKVLSAWMIARIGSKAEFTIDQLVQSMKIRTTNNNGTIFYWRDNQNPKEYKNYRAASNDNEKRSMDDICTEEVANAVEAVLKQQLSLSKTDLIRETAKLFGFTRLGNVIETSVLRGVAEAKLRGTVELSEDGERITLVE
jgi:hypothetical protein